MARTKLQVLDGEQLEIFSSSNTTYSTIKTTSARFVSNSPGSGYGLFVAGSEKVTIDSSGNVAIDALTVSLPVFTDTSKNLVSVATNTALNLLLPSQTSNSGKYLTTNGSNTSWGSIATGVSIGDPIGGGSPGEVLFVDATGLLGQNAAKFNYSDNDHLLQIGSSASTKIQRLQLSIGSGTGITTANTYGVMLTSSSPSFNTTSSNLSLSGFVSDLTASVSSGANDVIISGFAASVTGTTQIRPVGFEASVQGTANSIGFSVLNSSTGLTNYGFQSVVYGSGTSNYGIYSNTSGATNNYAIFTDYGDLRFGIDNTIKLGFFGVTPSARAGAFTQTYSTATHTHSNLTSSSVATTGSTNITPFGYTTAAQADNIITQLNNLITDVTNLKQVVNGIIDDLQAYGLLA